MPRRLYMELRVYYPPELNQEHLSEMAESLKDKLYDDLVNLNLEEYSATDITYEIVMEQTPDDVCACDGLTVGSNGELICSKCGKVQVN